MNNTQKSTPISKEEIPTLLNKAGQFYNARNLPEAEKIYRRILDTDPQNPYGLNMLGMIALDVGRLVDAEALVRKAIAGRNDLALFHDTLGTILMRQGKADEAISSFEKSLALKPDYVDSLNGLAGIFIFLERKDEALELFQRALAANPGHFNTLSNTGAALQHIGRHREAIEYYKKALDVNPHAADVYYNIGQAYRAINKLKEAKTYYYKAIECKPDYANAFLNLGYTYGEENNRDEALKYFYHTIQIEPNVNAYANIAHLLTKKGMLMGALEHYKLAHNISPSSPEILNNMGTIYNLLTRYEEAMDCYDKALAFDPNSANTFNNIGTTLKNLGRLDEAIETYKKAIELDPGRAEIHSNLLLVMNYSASVKPEELTAEAQKFDIIGKPFLRTRKMVRNFDPDRKLKIGYVSADFRSHAVHYFFEPLLNLRDSKQFEIYIYSNTEMEDEVTARLKKKCDHWHDIQTMSDEAVAILIESNKIDILMDISGHTGGNRLMAFARKPAPIQITWLAYPATTGLTAMDYRITDSYAEPPGMTEHLNTETLWRLPEIFCCYQADKNSPPVIDHPPFEDNGFITFGCFNNFSKVTDPVLSIWGKIMEQVPDSRLLLEISGIDIPAFREDVETRLKNNGIDPARVTLEQRLKANQFVLYNEIDIALDPFPCVGGTTSMDTLWMGVPFITLAGRHFGSRMGVTILTNGGLPELIAQNTEEYIQLAVSLANDRRKLKALRHNLRDKVAASPLMNQTSFTRNMEDAYRQMWKKYCASAI